MGWMQKKGKVCRIWKNLFYHQWESVWALKVDLLERFEPSEPDLEQALHAHNVDSANLLRYVKCECMMVKTGAVIPRNATELYMSFSELGYSFCYNGDDVLQQDENAQPKPHPSIF